MTHRSGLVNLPAGVYDRAPRPLVDVVHSLNNTVLLYPPGTHMKYSNAGVTVVGYALQRRAGLAFTAYLKWAVLDPAGLTSSGFDLTPELQRRLAKAFMWTYDGRVFPAPGYEWRLSGSGNVQHGD